MVDQHDPTKFSVLDMMNGKVCLTCCASRPPNLRTRPFATLGKSPQEMVQAFLNLRPDGFALIANLKKQEIALRKFTRAMDTDAQWEVNKDAEEPE